MLKTYGMDSGTSFRTLTILLLLILGVPTTVFGDVHLGGGAFAQSVNKRDVQEERDPVDAENCLALGELDIAFRTDNDGPPNIGVVVTDPRGRRIGFDPLTKHGWQELPMAQGWIDCDHSEGEDACRGLIEVCGPLSGTYKIEAIAQETSRYQISLFARSAETGYGKNLRSSNSDGDLSNIGIQKGFRDVITLNYSRDPAVKVIARLQNPQSQRYETRFQLTSHQAAKQKHAEPPVTRAGGD
jgi:hypothetical protein